MTPVRVLVLAVTLGTSLTLAAPPALANYQYTSGGTFATRGSGAGQLSEPADVAVDQSTGDVYVADTGNYRVVKFDSAGNFILAFGKGVDQTTGGDVCTAASGDTCQAGTPGSAPAEFTQPEFVAVDNSTGPSAGDVYVGDLQDGLVQKFDSAGNLITSWGDGGAGTCGSPNGQLSGGCASGGPFASIGSIVGIAVDPGGTLVAMLNTNNNSQVFEFAQDGSFTTGFPAPYPTRASGLALNAAGDLFKVGSPNQNVNEPSPATEELSPTGADIGAVTSDTGAGIAVDQSTGDLFVDTGVQVDRYVFESTRVVAESNGVGCPVESRLVGCPASETFGYGTITSNGGGVGIAVNSATGAVYVAQPADGDVQVFLAPTAGAPVITGAPATDETSSAATVFPLVYPDGLDTHVHLEYGTSTAYGQSTPDQAIAGDTLGHSVTSILNGLAPGTTYHYRLVASNSAGTVVSDDRTFQTQFCPNEQFRTGLGTYLPDCRAYEQVTPVDKNGAIDIYSNTNSVDTAAAVSADGNRVAFLGPAAWLPNADPFDDTYLFERGASGWQIASLRPADASPSATYLPYAPGSGQVHAGGTFSPDLTQFGVLVFPDFTNVGGSMSFEVGPAGGPFTTVASVADGSGDNWFVGSASDFSHVVLRSDDNALTGSANGTVAGAHDLYDYTGGALHLVNVNTDGSLTSACGAALPGDPDGESPNAVSSDGRTILFVSPDPNANSSDPSCQATPHLFARIDSGATDASTLDLGQVSQYLDATSDGHEVLFNSPSGLTLYDTTTETATLIRPAPSLDGVISSDGSTVYLEGARYDVASKHLTATIDGQVISVTPDGRFALLATPTGAGIPGQAPTPFPAIVRYDRDDGSVLCISCHPDGSGAQGAVSAGPINQAFVLRDLSQPGISNPMSADGSHVFFESEDQLTPRDANPGQAPGATLIAENPDVYEWEAEGTGGCGDPTGCLHLLTSGKNLTGADFLGATADGSNVFIATHDALAPSDTDQLGDIYDLRVDGGFGGPQPPPVCDGDCQSGAYGSPTPPTVASVSFSGPGSPSTSATTGRVRLVRKTSKGTRFVLSVRVPASGRITVTGAGVTRVSRTVGRSGTYAFTVSLTAREKELLKPKHKLRLALRVGYSPAVGSASSVTVSTWVRGR